MTYATAFPRRYLGTGAVARALEVDRKTILLWIKKGMLEAFKTPRGHNRCRVEDVVALRSCHGFELACVYCGCTQDRACEGGCTWIQPGVCSKCGPGRKNGKAR